MKKLTVFLDANLNVGSLLFADMCVCIYTIYNVYQEEKVVWCLIKGLVGSSIV